MQGRQISTPAASDDVAVQVDAIQYEVGDGPCLDAIREHETFRIDDLAGEDRWPAFSGRAAEETGVNSILSFRLFADGDTIGALNLSSKQPGAFDDEALAIGSVFAPMPPWHWPGRSPTSSCGRHSRAETSSARPRASSWRSRG